MSHGTDVYTSFIKTIENSLIGNIDTVATTNQCLEVWTNTTQELNEAMISDPVCVLANPDEAWDAKTNPYVPVGYSYPEDGSYTGTNGAWQCNYDANNTDPNADNEDQVAMVNSLNEVDSPDSMSTFISTYTQPQYTDDWSQSFANTVMSVEMDPNVYDPETDTEDSGEVTTNMNAINSQISLITADEQEATTPGNNEIKAIQSEEQTLSSYQDVFTGIARALGEVGQAVVTGQQNHF